MPAEPSTRPPAPPGGRTLLVAVTGPPGAGKTQLLAELAAWHAADGGKAQGFLAVAGRRGALGRGAEEYRLHLLATGENLPWAERDDTRTPPYRFAPATLARLRDWADALPAGSPLVVLDEFSRLEARGEGLMSLWPTILAALPRIVVMAVRQGVEAEIEARIGRSFDLRVDAASPDALARLEAACAAYGEWTRIGLFGGASGAIETTVGAALHMARVPLRGLALASLQGAMMTFTGFGLARPARVVWVPFIAAGLRALSPGGSRLRPMLAIAVQGAFYGAAVQVAGWNPLGVALGGALVGAWAGLQGIAIQYLTLGPEMVQAFDEVAQWLAGRWHISPPGFGALVGAWAAFHALAGGAATLAAWRLKAPPRRLRELIERESQHATNGPSNAGSGRRRRGGPLRELARWPFWLPLLVVSAILLGAGRPIEAVAWLVLRFAAVSMVLLALVSLVRPARWGEKLRRLGWWGPAVALAGAIERAGASGDQPRGESR